MIYAGCERICIQIKTLYMLQVFLIKIEFQLHSCVILLVLLLIFVSLFVGCFIISFPFLSFDAAKLLLHTAKTCQYLRKKRKKCIFLHFFPKYRLFSISFFLFLFSLCQNKDVIRNLLNVAV